MRWSGGFTALLGICVVIGVVWWLLGSGPGAPPGTSTAAADGSSDDAGHAELVGHARSDAALGSPRAAGSSSESSRPDDAAPGIVGRVIDERGRAVPVAAVRVRRGFTAFGARSMQDEPGACSSMAIWLRATEEPVIREKFS